METYSYYHVGHPAGSVSGLMSPSIAQNLPTGTNSRNPSLSRPELTPSWSQSSIMPGHEYVQNSTQVLGIPEGYEYQRSVVEQPPQPPQPQQMHSPYGEHAHMQQFTQYPSTNYQPCQETHSDINVSNWDTAGGMHVYPYGGMFDIPICLY